MTYNLYIIYNNNAILLLYIYIYINIIYNNIGHVYIYALCNISIYYILHCLFPAHLRSRAWAMQASVHREGSKRAAVVPQPELLGVRCDPPPITELLG